MKTVRILNEEGIKRFKEFLSLFRAGERLSPPLELLESPEHSERLSQHVEVEDRHFASRLDAAEYLAATFSGIRDVNDNAGLWTWLTLFYFDQVCPADEVGHRKVGQEARYIPGTTTWRYYRHLLARPFRIYQLYGQDAKLLNLLLKGPLDEPGEFLEQLTSRQEFITNHAIMGAATRLYFDLKRERPKRGATTKGKAGALRRFVDLVNQLELTYDLYSMEPSGLLNLLPEEFNRWRPDPAAATG